MRNHDGRTAAVYGACAAAWIGLMFFMGWFRKNKFKNDDARSNWIAQIVNAIGQTCLLLGIIFA